MREGKLFKEAMGGDGRSNTVQYTVSSKKQSVNFGYHDDLFLQLPMRREEERDSMDGFQTGMEQRRPYSDCECHLREGVR